MSNIYKEVIIFFGGQSGTKTKLGVSQPTVSGWLTGKHGMSAKVALKAQRLSDGKFKASDLCSELAETPISD